MDWITIAAILWLLIVVLFAFMAFTRPKKRRISKHDPDFIEDDEDNDGGYDPHIG